MSAHGLYASALAVVGAIGLSTSALAADLPVKARPIAAYNWTGFYVGANAGYGTTRTTTVNETDNPPTFINITAARRQFSFDQRSSFVGGIQAGYN